MINAHNNVNQPDILFASALKSQVIYGVRLEELIPQPADILCKRRYDMYKKSTINRILIAACAIFLLGSGQVSAYVLTEVAPSGTYFEQVNVTWTHDGQTTPYKSSAGGVTSVTFNTGSVETLFGLDKGYITDWKQYRKLSNGAESTLEGVFAKKGSDYVVLGYEDAYSQLGLSSSDFIYLPDFSADLDRDGTAETHLYSAINMFELVENYSSLFVNNMSFNYGQGYTIADFVQYGFIFSLSDNINFDSALGFQTSTPVATGTNMVADSTHITGVPEPHTVAMLIFGIM